MNMLDIVVQLTKELRGMQIGNRNLYIKICNLKRRVGELQNVVIKWKAKHQRQHDIAEHLLSRIYSTSAGITSVPYKVWRYDYLRSHGYVDEFENNTLKEDWVDISRFMKVKP
jgi:hypothetical protein